MKKLYISLLLGISFITNAQNLVTNHSFDEGLDGWSAGPIGSYTLPTFIAEDGSDGANSVQYIATATTGFYQEIDIVGGSQLDISFWYKATGDNTDARIWSNYKDADDTVVFGTDNAATDPLRTNNGYLPTVTEWEQHTITVTAPEVATKFVLAVRAYNGGTVSFDDFSVIQTPLSVKDNNISGLKVYPNPVTNGTLYIATDANAEKTVHIYDILGKQVLNTVISSESVNVSALNSGVYMVKITEEGKTATRKLVVQ